MLNSKSVTFSMSISAVELELVDLFTFAVHISQAHNQCESEQRGAIRGGKSKSNSFPKNAPDLKIIARDVDITFEHTELHTPSHFTWSYLTVI